MSFFNRIEFKKCFFIRWHIIIIFIFKTCLPNFYMNLFGHDAKYAKNKLGKCEYVSLKEIINWKEFIQVKTVEEIWFLVVLVVLYLKIICCCTLDFFISVVNQDKAVDVFGNVRPSLSNEWTYFCPINSLFESVSFEIECFENWGPHLKLWICHEIFRCQIGNAFFCFFHFFPLPNMYFVLDDFYWILSGDTQSSTSSFFRSFNWKPCGAVQDMSTTCFWSSCLQQNWWNVYCSKSPDDYRFVNLCRKSWFWVQNIWRPSEKTLKIQNHDFVFTETRFSIFWFFQNRWTD